MTDKRYIWIDALKGFGMILVILGHMSIPELARQWIFSFHMPLFFFISGYLHKDNLSIRWVMGKFDGLMIPYVFYGVITLCVLVYVGRIDCLDGLLLLAKGKGLGVLWFLVCLLITELVGATCVRLARGRERWCLPLVAIALAGLEVLVVQYCRIGYFKLDVVPAAVVFWLCGRLMRDMSPTRWLWVASIICAPLFLVQRVDMASAEFGNAAAFYGAAFGFIYLFVTSFRMINITLPPLVFIGQRSLEFMCLHELVPVFLGKMFADYGIVMPKWLMRVVFLLLLVALSWVVHKYVQALSEKVRLSARRHILRNLACI